MKSISTLLLLLFLGATHAQTIDVSPWLKTKTVDGQDITILRAPDTQFGSALVGPVSFTQYSLDRLNHAFTGNSGSIDDDYYKDAEKYIAMIVAASADFPVQHYRAEIDAYKRLCVESAAKRVARQKAMEEADFFKRLKSNFAWTSSEAVTVYTKPDVKSSVLGKLGRLSYLHAYDVEHNEDWVEIKVGEHKGFVQREHIAIDWDELDPTAADSTELRRGAYYDFTASPAYAAQLKKAEAEEARELRAMNAAPRRKYYVGPKGGCYYINSHGNKQYVDHSYCR